MRKRALPGDLIAVPVAERWAIGKVIFVSKYFRDIMLIAFRGPFSSPSAKWRGGAELGSFYTAATKFAKRGWKIVGSDPVTDVEARDTVRLVADEVWELDTIVRKATPEDKRLVPIMAVDGFIRVETVLRRRIQECG